MCYCTPVFVKKRALSPWFHDLILLKTAYSRKSESTEGKLLMERKWLWIFTNVQKNVERGNNVMEMRRTEMAAKLTGLLSEWAFTPLKMRQKHWNWKIIVNCTFFLISTVFDKHNKIPIYVWNYTYCPFSFYNAMAI